MNKFTFLILGAGRQGTAAGYDLARWGEAKRIIFADQSLGAAQKAKERINSLIGQDLAFAARVDVSDHAELAKVMAGCDACISCVPYIYNLNISRAAVASRVNICDLGGNTELAREQHQLNDQAQALGISVIPNCGQVPGLGSSLVVYAMGLLDEPRDVYMWDGGIPQNPRLPFNYLLTFHIAGLTNEYAEPAVFIRDWKVTRVEPMTELTTVEFPPPIGRLEAFVTGGGTDTMPWTFEGKLRTLQNLTLRHPGNYSQLRAFYDLGLWDTKPIKVGDTEIIPREVFHTLFEPKVVFPEDKDIVIVRVSVYGKKQGREAEAFVELIDYYDQATGFTAMERGTGWSAAIVAELMVRGQTPKGAGGVESMVPAALFVENLRNHGFNVVEKVSIL